MTQAAAVVVRPEPVARVALRIMHVVRTIRNFLVTRRWRSDLTGLYDFCLGSLFQVVYPHPEGLERAAAALHELRRGETQMRRAERQALPAQVSAPALVAVGPGVSERGPRASVVSAPGSASAAAQAPGSASAVAQAPGSASAAEPSWDAMN